MQNKIKLLNKSVDGRFYQKFDLIVSNPPYIMSNEIKNLEADIRRYEPLIALDGGNDGLHCYRALAVQAKARKIPVVLVEIGIGQSIDVMNIFQEKGYKHCTTHRDLGGTIRVIVCSLESPEV